MENANTSVIEITKGNEYRVLIEDIYDSEKFFYPVYKRSIEIIDEICLNNKYDDSQKEIEIGMYPNNIVMFCADRGCGKSSAMISVSNALRNLHNDDSKKARSPSAELNRIKNKCAFSVLNAIDPTTVGEKELFMRVVLSRMFKNIRHIWDKEEANCADMPNRNKLLISKFKKCYSLLDVIYQDGGKFTTDDDLYDLAELGDSSNLRKEFKELVDCYLEEALRQTDKSIKRFMVIQLDDADLNAKMAYSIIEDIRKYCIIPNVVILMAVNMEQMQQVINQHFFAEFKGVLDVERGVPNSDTYYEQVRKCYEMSVRYIDKLLPPGHQIHLPKIDEFIRNASACLKVKYIDEIEDENGNISKKDLLEFEDKKSEQISDYQERLLRLIYNKTNIVLVKPQNGMHEFLPRTMRELAHFLNYVCKLPDLEEGVFISANRFYWDEAELNELRKVQNNISALERFFIQNWCDTNLSKKYSDIINDIADTDSDKRVYAAIKRCRRMLGDKNIDDLDSSHKSLASLQIMLKRVSEVTEGDSNRENLANINRFVFALQFYFTLFFNSMFYLCIERDDNFNLFYEAVDYEMWAPNYSELLHGLPNGRFEIDYKILTKCMNELSVSSLESTPTDIKRLLRSCCLIKIGGVNHLLDLDSFEVVEALNELNNNTNSNRNIVIMFDYALLLFSVGLNDIEDDIDILDIPIYGVYSIISSNILLMLNLEVQQYIEKRTYVRRGKSPNHYDWQSDFLQNINSNLNHKIQYLPLYWNIKGENVGKIPLSNKNYVIETAKYNISQLAGEARGIAELPNPQENEESFKEFITNYSKTIVNAFGSWENYALELFEIPEITSITNLKSTWDRFSDALTDFREREKEQLYNEDITKMNELRESFIKWKTKITNSYLPDTVVSQIEKVF